jgi:hypothetical protein
MKLDWKKLELKFKENPNKHLWVASVHQYFDPKELQTLYQNVSDTLKNESKHNFSIACAIHYEQINKWIAGQFTNCGEPVVITDIRYNQAFEVSDIDGVELYLIVNDDGHPNPTTIHPNPTIQ